MESANKAIMMAFGMLVAVMIIGTIVFVFNNLKVLPEGDDTKEEIEQISAFNLEYEVYDKKIMYGVDIISVLNKAKSNNDKYVKGNFLNGTGYNTDYIIDIEVTLKTALEEKFVVTYLEQTRNGVVEREYPTNQGLNHSNANNASGIKKFKKPSQKYCELIYNSSNFWNNLTLKSQVVDTKIKSGTYHLLSGNDNSIVPGKYTNEMLDGDSTLKALLEQSTEMSQTIKNTSSNKMIVRNGNQVDETNTGWNKATWYPAIYDLKTKKFKCKSEEMVYSEKNSRIIKMAFEEI